MPPRIAIEPQQPPPEGPRARTKQVVRILFHLWHLFIVFLLYLIIISAFALGPSWDPGFPHNFYILYLVPLTLYNLIFTFVQLFNIDGSRFLPRPLNFGIFARIRFRSYLYQAAAAISLCHGRGGNPFEVGFAFVVWIFGIWMFILGCIANEFGFLDWIQEVQKEEEEEEPEEPQRVRLLISSDDDDEGDEGDLFESTVRRERRRKPRRSKQFVRNVVHIWEVLTILLLVPIVLLSFIPRDRVYDSLMNMYLIPVIIFSLAYAFYWLFKKKEEDEEHGTRRGRVTTKIIKTFLTRRQFGFFSRIRVRGFVYQAFAVIPLSGGRRFWSWLASLVWISGMALFILGCIASEWGFLDWVQEEEGKEDSVISIFASSDEEDEESLLGDQGNTAQATGEQPDALHV